MYNIGNQTTEQKRKQQKINMILNNLEEQLCGNEELCRGIVKIIDMKVEADELVGRLESIKTTIPAMEERRVNLINECLTSCSETRKNICSRIIDILEENNKKEIPAKMIKIHSTIDSCIAHYSLYKKSEYFA